MEWKPHLAPNKELSFHKRSGHGREGEDERPAGAGEQGGNAALQTPPGKEAEGPPSCQASPLGPTPTPATARLITRPRPVGAKRLCRTLTQQQNAPSALTRKMSQDLCLTQRVQLREREREETGRNRQKRKNILSITFFLQLVREGGGWKQQMVIGQRRNGCPPV